MIMLMKNRYRKLSLAAIVLSALLLLVLFILTDPRTVGLFGILVVILAIYALFASCFYILSTLLKSSKDSGDRRKLLIAMVLAFAPVLLIIFNSLGVVGILELIAIVLFEIITIFLITKRTS